MTVNGVPTGLAGDLYPVPLPSVQARQALGSEITPSYQQKRFINRKAFSAH